MMLIEKEPNAKTVAKYVDRYQVFMIDEPAFLKTIPNGKIDCYLVKKGSFSRWDEETGTFVSNSLSGVLPATNSTSYYHIPNSLLCLNIKLKLNVLSLSIFNEYSTNRDNFEVANLISEAEQKSILSKIDEDNPDIAVDDLDNIIESALQQSSIDERMDRVIELIEHRITSKFKVAELASALHMTEKSMSRWIKKQFNMTPKELWQIIRFENVSHTLKAEPDRNHADSLEFGYYDQSHFIKECRKITGYSPKAFFSKMKLSTNDVIFE